MLIIGLTGGIGSGKTTVSTLFSMLGVPVIDADLIAKELFILNPKIQEKLVMHFGPEILDSDHAVINPQKIVQENNAYPSIANNIGRLNRAKLQARIFENTQEKKWLEHLLHPYITQEIKTCIANLKSPYCIVVIPLLAEISESQSLANRILVVDVPEEAQLNRTMQRDSLAEAMVKKIIQSQATRADRLSIADDILHNESDIALLKPQVFTLHQRYLCLAQKYLTQ